MDSFDALKSTSGQIRLSEPRPFVTILAYLALATASAIAAYAWSDLPRYVAGALAAIMLLSAAAALRDPGTLTVTRDGFSYTLVGQRIQHEWAQVHGFYTIERRPLLSRRRTVVGIDFVKGKAGIYGARSVRISSRLTMKPDSSSRVLKGEAGWLPSTYGLEADQVANLLERWRRGASLDRYE